MRGWRWSARVLVTLVAVSLVVGAALTLHNSQANARKGVEDRYAAKAGLAANFVSTYVSQLTTREQWVARSTLAGPAPQDAFAREVAAFGFQEAVLLDSSGHALSIAPNSTASLGVEFGTKYPQLATALNGDIGVSGVVVTAVDQLPVVAFAVPFDTPQGRRVFSGAYLVSDTPLAAFLSDTTSMHGARLYLTDSSGAVISTNRSGGLPASSVETLAQRDPDLYRASVQDSQGQYTLGSVGYNFARTPVPGTPWTLLMAVPSSALFASIEGSSHWLPWLILTCLSLLLGLAGWLAIRLEAGRRRLADANGKLASIAQTDLLTGLSNRGHLTEQLDGLLANSSRHGFPLCVLMIDIDRFKQLNDTHGHRAGDLALREVAQRLDTTLRRGDLIARWGGEEFLAVLPYSELAESVLVAERLCAEVSGSGIEVGLDGTRVMVKVSVGVALAGDDSLEALVHRADLGLYEAKAAGRGTVRVGRSAGVADRSSLEQV
jgi:diguanylate cyclase (GGDEF)-like protein